MGVKVPFFGWADEVSQWKGLWDTSLIHFKNSSFLPCTLRAPSTPTYINNQKCIRQNTFICFSVNCLREMTTLESWAPFSEQPFGFEVRPAQRCTTWWLKTTQSHIQQLWAKGRQLCGDGLSNKDKSSKTTCPAEWDRGLSTRHRQNTAPSIHLWCVFEFSISAAHTHPCFSHFQPCQATHNALKFHHKPLCFKTFNHWWCSKVRSRTSAPISL